MDTNFLLVEVNPRSYFYISCSSVEHGRRCESYLTGVIARTKFDATDLLSQQGRPLAGDCEVKEMLEMYANSLVGADR